MTTYLMKFTEEELEVIYLLAERDQSEWEYSQDEAIKRVIDKVCANKIGPGAHFTGAIGVLYDD